MSEVVVIESVSAGESDPDLMILTGTVNGVPIEAHGWFSAETNYYPPEAYHADGTRDDIPPRTMTAEESVEYRHELMVTQYQAEYPQESESA